MKAILMLILLSLMANNAFGVDLKTIYLPQGQPAQFSGYLFTPSDAAEAAQNKQAVGTYKLLTESLQTSLNLETQSKEDEQKKNGILQGDLTDTTKALNDQKSLSDWQKLGYFALGVLATYGTLRLAAQVNTH